MCDALTCLMFVRFNLDFCCADYHNKIIVALKYWADLERGKMSKLKGIIYTCILAIMCNTAFAQMTIIIDNQLIPTADIESIVISHNSNVINIATTRRYIVEPATVKSGVVINNFSVTPGSILENETTTVSWDTTEAVSCTPSGGTGGWNALNIDTSGSIQLTATASGTYTFSLTCSGSGVGDTDTRDVILSVSAPDAVSILGFVASPLSITEGGFTTLSWVTENAASCTPSGGNVDWRATNITVPTGSVDIVLSTAGTYTFTLTCIDSNNGQAVKPVTVIANADSGECQAVPLAGTVKDWKAFWQVDFPYPGYGNKVIDIPRTGYAAIKFNSGNIVDNGAYVTVESTASSGSRHGSISECPGDFEVPAECQHVWGLGGGIGWSVNKSVNGACALKPNTTYYFNVTFTDGFDPTSSTCDDYYCRTTLQHINP